MNLSANHCSTIHIGDPPLWWGPWDTDPYSPPYVPPHPIYPSPMPLPTPWVPKPFPNPWCPTHSDYWRGYQAGRSEGKTEGEAVGRIAGGQTENQRLRQRLLQAGFVPEVVDRLLGYGSPVAPPVPVLAPCPRTPLDQQLDKVIQECQKARQR